MATRGTRGSRWQLIEAINLSALTLHLSPTLSLFCSQVIYRLATDQRALLHTVDAEWRQLNEAYFSPATHIMYTQSSVSRCGRGCVRVCLCVYAPMLMSPVCVPAAKANPYRQAVAAF